MYSLIAPLLVVAGLALPPMEPVHETVGVYRGLDFAVNDGVALQLDFYRPRNAPEPLPAIVVITGGAFFAQESKKFKDEARILAESGFAAASISYRGWPGHTFPAPVEDAKAAVRFLRAHAADLNIDPDRIGAFGQSAGAYLAGMVAVTSDEKEFEGQGGNGEISSRVRAVVCFSGIFDLVHGEDEEKDGGSIAKRAFNRLWLGGPLAENRELWRRASPINHISPDDPPMLLIHSKKDSMVPWRQSELMHEALKTARPESELLLLDKGGHNIRDNRKVRGEAWTAAIAFFKKHL